MDILAELIVVVVAIIAMIVLPMLLTIVVGLWEKRMVWPYVPLEDPVVLTTPAKFDPANPYAVSGGGAQQIMQPTEQAAKANVAAQSLGFRYLGAYRHGGGAVYKVRYDFWVSGEHEVLVIVGGGTMASIPLDNTWLFTQLAEGPMLVTITAHNAGEYDLSGLTSEVLVRKAGLAQAIHAHLGRMKLQSSPALNYSDAPLSDHFQFRKSWSEQLERKGLVRFVDPARNVWKYTLWGAVRFAVRANLVNTGRMLSPTSWVQRTR
jgi:hypothetical protein